MPHNSKSAVFKGLIPAAAYIRMSGHKQERSPAQQKAEILKLAAREGCEVVEWFEDHAITGDSGPLERSGFREMLEAAEQGKYQRLLAYDQDRIGRFDSIDAGQWMAPLRAAGVTITTCVQGKIDWNTFEGRIIYTVNQEGKKRFLEELSGKVVRGQIDNAKAGGHNGGPAIYGMDRGLFDASGNLVRRLLPGESVRMDGHRVYLLPGTDPVKIDAVRFAFGRFDKANVSIRELARELEAKGYPSPTGKGWTHHNVCRMLRSPAYVGTARWGARAWGKYREARGDDIVPVDANRKGVKAGSRRYKPQEDAISVDGAHEGIIPIDLFSRVQRKLPQSEKPCRAPRRTEYPLRGLIFCGHCGQPMQGCSRRLKDHKGKVVYFYSHYICSTAADHGRGKAGKVTCRRNPIDTARVLAWLLHKLQEVFLGPGRAALVQEIKNQLGSETKANSGDVDRLQKRAADLDREVGRLVKAIRTVDAAELVEELAIVRGERERVKAALADAGRLATPTDLAAEAERIADTLVDLGGRLNDSDPAILRRVLQELVSRITCRWEPGQGKGRTAKCRLAEGIVELRQQTPFSVCQVVASELEHGCRQAGRVSNSRTFRFCCRQVATTLSIRSTKRLPAGLSVSPLLFRHNTPRRNVRSGPLLVGSTPSTQTGPHGRFLLQ